MQSDDTRSHDLFLAWAAGFVDGEGWLGIAFEHRGQSTRYRPVISVENTALAPIDELRHAVGVGTLRVGHFHATRHRASYVWRVSGSSAQRFVAEIRPHLRVKAKQADLLIAFPLMPHELKAPRVDPDIRARREEILRAQAAIWAEMRLLNRKGPEPPVLLIAH